MRGCHSVWSTGFVSSTAITAWVLNTGIPRWDKGGTFAGYIGSCVEITDGTIAEQSCVDTHAEFGRVSRSQRSAESAAFIAHEVRQLLRRHASHLALPPEPDSAAHGLMSAHKVDRW